MLTSKLMMVCRKLSHKTQNTSNGTLKVYTHLTSSIARSLTSLPRTPDSSQRRVQTLVRRGQTRPSEKKCNDELALHRRWRFRSDADGCVHQLFGQVGIFLWGLWHIYVDPYYMQQYTIFSSMSRGWFASIRMSEQKVWSARDHRPSVRHHRASAGPGEWWFRSGSGSGDLVVNVNALARWRARVNE